MKIDKKLSRNVVPLPQAMIVNQLIRWGQQIVSQIFPHSSLGKSDFILFNGLKNHFLLFYLVIMEITIIFFSSCFFLLLNHDVFGEIDQKLMSLAQFAAPALSQYSSKKQIVPGKNLPPRLDRLQDNRLQDNYFLGNSSLGIEWFDQSKQVLFRQGKVIPASKPEIGLLTIDASPLARIRSATIKVSIDRSQSHLPPIQGYVRISQSLSEFDNKQHQRLIILGVAIGVTLGLATLGGFWLTQKVTEPVELNVERLKQFTEDASHELRSPLTAIQSSLEVLRNHPERIHAKDIRKIAVMTSAADKMTHLVKDLLFLARADSDESVYSQEWTTISLNHLLRELIDWLDPVAQEKQVLLSYHQSLDVFIKGNQAQLTRLFSNLLENALNYTPKSGQVTIWVNQDKHWVQINIEDTGIGITEENLPYIFDRFWRADKARSRRAGGTGLGLSIAQAIACNHNGEITVSSQLNKGSCFTVCLPLAKT